MRFLLTCQKTLKEKIEPFLRVNIKFVNPKVFQTLSFVLYLHIVYTQERAKPFLFLLPFLAVVRSGLGFGGIGDLGRIAFSSFVDGAGFIVELDTVFH